MTKSPYFVGTSGWTYDHWKGNFYPSSLARKDWFGYYAEHFNAVEINATFYRKFKDQTYTNWAIKAPDYFKYVLKVPRIITHRKFLVGCEDDIFEFCRSSKILKEKLGLLLLQLPPRISFNPEWLKNALAPFGNPEKLAVEFRNKSWLTEETRNLLRDVGAAFCNVDSPMFSFLKWITSDTAYIRLHGRKSWYSYNYSDVELAEIAEAAKRFISQGARQVYIFFNNDFGGFAPMNALRLIEIIGRQE